MSKTGKARPFSIYLLKNNYNATNALKQGHKLEAQAEATSLPADASLFVLDAVPTPPWWTTFFGIKKDIRQASKGALVFLPVGERCFALSFGHVHHNLKDDSFEYDFGLRVTLNCVDPNELKSTDTLEPGSARRRRTQLPVGSDLTFFDFDRDSAILKSLTGKVGEAYKTLFKNATGDSGLTISSKVSPSGLVTLCEQLLKLYESTTYLTSFPEIQNIAPVRDPAIISTLNQKLVQALRTKDTDSLYLAIPEIVDYQSGSFYASFSGLGSSLVFEDVYLNKYYEYLESMEHDLDSIGYEDLKKHSLVQTDEEGTPRAKRYSIWNCLIFDTDLGGQQTYHLAEGKWYKVENAYLEKIRTYLDSRWKVLSLPPYKHVDEEEYNEAVAAEGAYICLDQTNISPPKQTQIEPCDLYAVESDCAVFHHIKISTLSNQLSHQFNQGANAMELLKQEPSAIETLKDLIAGKVTSEIKDALLKPIDEKRFCVSFGIVTHKDSTKKSDNLPLFSRISLMRVVKALQLMGTTCAFGFIADESVAKPGVKKKRKKKNSIGTDAAKLTDAAKAS